MPAGIARQYGTALQRYGLSVQLVLYEGETHTSPLLENAMRGGKVRPRLRHPAAVQHCLAAQLRTGGSAAFARVSVCMGVCMGKLACACGQAGRLWGLGCELPDLPA